ncbi:MAG: hypothetical protein H5T68_01220 [Chloroflexi bacterium]|nr:hypothetical protein [Chloroflexota bacterium]
MANEGMPGGQWPESGGARRYDEKDEKEEEKRDEKEEKGGGWGRDPVSGVLWALFLIAVGLILLAESQGFITWEQFGGVWNLIFLAAGLLLLTEAAIRLLIPAYRRPVLGTLIGGIVLTAIGLGGVIGFRLTLPIILIGIGLAILLGGLFRSRF